jgi:bacterioferritin-associated ferredoxin
MLICHCNSVSDHSIRKAVREGAVSVEDVARSCGAGACCGGCQSAVEDVIHIESAHHSTSGSSVVAGGASDA